MYILLGIVGSVGIIIGATISFIFCKRAFNKSSVGTLRIDQSDLDGPFLFLELDKSFGVRQIMQNKKVIFDVKVEDYVTLK